MLRLTLKVQNNIAIRCVMPISIETAAIPGFSKSFLPAQMTWRSTLLSGYDVFVKDRENMGTGETLKIEHDKLVDWGIRGIKVVHSPSALRLFSSFGLE